MIRGIEFLSWQSSEGCFISNNAQLTISISRLVFSLLFRLPTMDYILHLATNIFHFFTGHYFQQTADPILSSKSQNMKNIVLLGGSYAGITAAHGILKQAAKIGPFKITLVSPSTHHYGNMASARGIVPDQFTDEQLFVPIAPGFAQYPSTRFEFILASAESLDVGAKTIRISSATGKATLQYDFLILATGSRTTEPTPFKGLGPTEATKTALHDFQARVRRAKKIVVAGAGITGVEVAGELGYYGHSKKIILVSIYPSAAQDCGIPSPLHDSSKYAGADKNIALS